MSRTTHDKHAPNNNHNHNNNNDDDDHGGDDGGHVKNNNDGTHPLLHNHYTRHTRAHNATHNTRYTMPTATCTQDTRANHTHAGR